jgi:hypothetical protein
MSVMPVPELPGALCCQHPDPDLWTSDMRSEQEEARRICPELADCRAWTLARIADLVNTYEHLPLGVADASDVTIAEPLGLTEGRR